MNKKDLYNGLTNVSEDLLEEAEAGFSQPADQATSETKAGKATHVTPFRKRPFMPAAVAAILVITLLSGVTLKQHMTITGLQEQVASLSSKDGVGTDDSDSLGDRYYVASSYGDVYDLAKEMADNSGGSGLLDFFATGSGNSSKGVVYEEAADAAEVATTSGTSDYSKTNVVTEGVDESDIVKTDGKFIYTVQHSSILITDIRKGKPGKQTTLTLDGSTATDQIQELYVADGTLTAIVNRVDEDSKTYCYVYDIADPTHPSLVGSMHQDGNYYTSRKIGNTVYLFTDRYLNYPDLSRKNALLDKNLEKWLPTVNDTLVNSNAIYLHDNGYFGTLISSFDISNPSKTIDAKYIVNEYSQEYVSSSDIIFYETEYVSSRNVTHLTQIKLDNGKLKNGASTTLSGEIRDTFAIQKSSDYLRVLTTDYSGSTEVNTLFVLDDSLTLQGRIDDIAKGESIYAARYVGDLVYFITYKNTDPLFVADLSDPKNPKLLGELEVDGFSEYLHLWDDTHLLGIGYDNDNNHVLLTMFDISDPANLKVLDQYTIEDSNSSPVCYGLYKAALVSNEKGIIGLPILKEFKTPVDPQEEDADYMDYNYEYQSSYELFTYSDEKGFETKVSKKLKYDEPSDYRGLFSGNHFYIAGSDDIQYVELK